MFEAGTDTDALVAAVVGEGAVPPPPYSTDWQAAIGAGQMVFRPMMYESHQSFGHISDNFQVTLQMDGSWTAGVFRSEYCGDGYLDDRHGNAPSGPLAICRAILAATQDSIPQAGFPPDSYLRVVGGNEAVALAFGPSPDGKRTWVRWCSRATPSNDMVFELRK